MVLSSSLLPTSSPFTIFHLTLASSFLSHFVCTDNLEAASFLAPAFSHTLVLTCILHQCPPLSYYPVLKILSVNSILSSNFFFYLISRKVF